MEKSASQEENQKSSSPFSLFNCAVDDLRGYKHISECVQHEDHLASEIVIPLLSELVPSSSATEKPNSIEFCSHSLPAEAVEAKSPSSEEKKLLLARWDGLLVENISNLTVRAFLSTVGSQLIYGNFNEKEWRCKLDKIASQQYTKEALTKEEVKCVEKELLQLNAKLASDAQSFSISIRFENGKLASSKIRVENYIQGVARSQRPSLASATEISIRPLGGSLFPSTGSDTELYNFDGESHLYFGYNMDHNSTYPYRWKARTYIGAECIRDDSGSSKENPLIKHFELIRGAAINRIGRDVESK